MESSSWHFGVDMEKRKERLKNLTLRDSVGGMGKSAFSGRNYFELLIINVGWLGKIFSLASRKVVTGSPFLAPWPLDSTELCQELMFPMSQEEMNLLAKSVDSGARWPGFKSTSCESPPAWSCREHGTRLCLPLLIHETGTESSPLS